jgi:HAD superfamily hydrolase (TIGR01509 family)
MNFVFDLGGVVVEWNPRRIVAPFHLDRRDETHLISALFSHPSWLDFDRGSVTVDEIVAGASDRSGFSRKLIRDVVDSVPQSLAPFEEMVEMILAIDRSRHSVLCLSNISPPSLAHLEETLPMDRLFGGQLFSCRIGAVKPEPSVFATLISRFDLDPKQTVFFDDVATNVAAAREHGIDARQFTGFEECRRMLEALDAFPV